MTRYGTPNANKNNYRHGHAYEGRKTRTYRIWAGVIQRCTNPNTEASKYYADRGISICARWRVFKNFLEDMGECPGPGYSIDRFPDRKGNYEPGNVRWATGKEQQRNRDDRKLYDYHGELYLICELAELSGLPFATLQARITRYGWSVIEAVEMPVRAAAKYTHAGVSMTLDEWAKHIGRPRKFLEKRLRLKWSFESAITRPSKQPCRSA